MGPKVFTDTWVRTYRHTARQRLFLSWTPQNSGKFALLGTESNDPWKCRFSEWCRPRPRAYSPSPLGSSEAFPVHGTWNAYTPLPATTHSCRKIEPPPPTRDATQTWPYILVGWCPPSPAGYWTPPRRSHTDFDCGCAYAHFVTQRRLDPKCHWSMVQPLCHEAAPTIGAEY